MSINRRSMLQGLGATAASCVFPAGAAIGHGSKILVGQSAALTGPAAALGLEMQQGILAAFAEVNSVGGINGRQLALVSRDDGYEPERAAANTRALIETDSVFALLGYVGTPTTNASLPILTSHTVPLVGAFTGAQSLRNPINPFVFNVRASYMDEGPHLVRALLSMGAQKVAIFHQDDAYGQAVRKSIDAALAPYGKVPVAYATHKRNSSDVSEAVKSIIESGATAVAMGSTFKPSVELVRQLRAKGHKYIAFASVSYVGTRQLIEEGGRDVRGVFVTQVMPYPKVASSAIVGQYQRAMKMIESSELTYGSIEGYISARTLISGLQSAGTDASRLKFINALDSMKKVDLGGFKVDYSKDNHNGSNFVETVAVGSDSNILR